MFDTRPNRPQRSERTRAVPMPDRTQMGDPAYYPEDQPTAPAIREVDPRSRQRMRRGPRRGLTPRAIIVGSIAGFSVFAILGVLMIVGAYLYFQIFELIVPGVHVGSIRLGGQTRQEATQKLSEAWSGGQGVLLSDGEQNWVASPADFGMTLDPQGTAERAYDVGHGGPIFDEFFTLFDSTAYGTSVTPMVAFDEAKTREGLTTWAQTLNRVPQDASIKIENGQVVAVPGVQGYGLNVDATLLVIASDPAAAISNGYLPLVLDPVAPRISDASGAVAEAQALLANPLIVDAYDPISDQHLNWKVEPPTIVSWLGVETNETGPHAVVQADRLSAWITEMGGSLTDGRFLNAEQSAPELEAALHEGRSAMLIVKHPPTTYTVEGGDTLTRVAWKVGIPYWRILDVNPGLDANGINPGQVINIPSKDDLLPLPVVPSKRIVVSMTDQHAWAYENGQQVYDFVISTGIDRSPTQPGIFQVQSHEASVYAPQWDLTMPNFLAIYEAWPGFFNGFHGLPTLSGGQLLWREVLGRPASYGCIILDLDDGQTLYDWAQDGTVVEIRE